MALQKEIMEKTNVAQVTPHPIFSFVRTLRGSPTRKGFCEEKVVNACRVMVQLALSSNWKDFAPASSLKVRGKSVKCAADQKIISDRNSEALGCSFGGVG